MANNTDKSGYSLVVMTLAVTSIAVSQFGSGCYSNSDIIMGVVAIFVLFAVSVTNLTTREKFAYSAVWALIGFHFTELLTKYGEGCANLASYGFNYSEAISALLFLVSLLILLIKGRSKKKS